MNNVLGILIHFYGNQLALTGDISKVYHVVKIQIIDQQTQTFLWRDMKINQEPDPYDTFDNYTYLFKQW